MLPPERLNPEEVLDHLKSLGYDYISPQQLKDFIHDLKKLIKYEQKQKLRSSLGTESVKTNSSESGYSCSEYDDSSNKSYCKESDCESSVSSCSTSTTYNSKFNEIGKYNSRNPSESMYTVPTSFIRPWNLCVYKDLSTRGKKNLDPVRLYHHYKEFWKNQNIPGENKHSELRWVVRNRMLGQEPHPRIFIPNSKNL